MGGFVK